jgi:hypothetical protein
MIGTAAVFKRLFTPTGGVGGEPGDYLALLSVLPRAG